MASKKEAKPENKLTVKQHRFVEEYCINGYNASEAARIAGYSEDSARDIACENLTKPNIRAAIDERLKTLSLTADETLKGISDIARSSLNDYFEVKQVYHTPQVQKHLSVLISEIEAEIEDAEKFFQRAGINEEEFTKDHLASQHRRRLQILKYEIELERNPDATRLVDGEPYLIEQAELDLAKLVKDKEAGRIKSVSPTPNGTKVEMYAADAALTNLARIHGLFEKDNKQVKPESNVTIFQLPDNGRD
ncbi:terminase small subunit [Pontibacter qinzhouensis]|uniref:Terminase small subunit n=1 Tax=Pontibacter qinzhouensis TaxID=2603253 RepID=A0A5C8KEY4_9BACT|nr:terminase small subunit [Pontibacter qinzhouensis]TXK52372.1 terminase small subunit [Pontibacter qinzhouensis]